TILSQSDPRRTDPGGESEEAYIERLAARLEKDVPASRLPADLAPWDFAGWAQAGYRTTKASLYPASLQRGVEPSADYKRAARAIAEPAMVLAGLRLAVFLNQALAAPALVAAPSIAGGGEEKALAGQFFDANLHADTDWLAAHVAEDAAIIDG